MAGLTSQQSRAIETRDVSVALSAGAGCGKTFVLTERFLSHLDPAQDSPAALGELLAITFTERAAREMRDRIRRFCYERIRSAPEGQSSQWSELLRELDTARVTTIHAFCAALLRRHAIEAGLDPQFAVLEQTQSDLLLHELIDDALREKLASRHETTIELMAAFGLVALRDRIRRLLESTRGADIDAWLKKTPSELVETWQRYARERVWPTLLKNLSQSTEAQQLLRLLREAAPDNDEMRERVERLECLSRLDRESDPQAALELIIEWARVGKGAAKKNWADGEDYESYRDSAKVVRESATKALSFFSIDATAAQREAAVALQILELVEDVTKAYSRHKQELGALDFDDLVIEASRLLGDPEHVALRKRVSEQFSMVMVDEFQDTDRVQVELVKALCGGDVKDGKLFFVGDFKQSIYRFRGADPDVFAELQDEVPEAGQMALTLNFRSQPAVLSFVNTLFYDRFAAAYEPLTASRPAAPKPAATEFLWATDDGSPRSAGATARARDKEAKWIARRIRRMIENEEQLVVDRETEQPRAVKQGDIAILFRALSDVQSYEEALSRRGIDYYLVGGHAFYAQQEIFDLVNLFKVLTSRSDAVALAGVLRSPMFALKDATLFWLAQNEEGLSAGLFADTPPAELDQEQTARVKFAASTIAHLRRIKDRVPIATLLDEALGITAYDAILLGEYLGERKLANVHKIVDQARSMDRAGFFTLEDFVVQLSQFVAQQPREPLAATQPEASDVVRLMTIHQAKGLEFPVVIVPDLDRRPRSTGSGITFTPELGPLVRLPSSERGQGVAGYDLNQIELDDEERKESDRLFYVATTRAADHLILSSSVFNLEKPSGPWLRILAERFDLETGELRGHLPTGYDTPKIQVTLEEPALRSKAESFSRRAPVAKMLESLDAASAAHDPTIAAGTQAVEPDKVAQVEFSFSSLSGSLSKSDSVDQNSPNGADERLRSDHVQDDAAKLGTLVHNVLANIDFRSPGSVETLVQRHAERLVIESSTLRRDACQLVGQLLESPFAKALAAASQVLPELEFLLAWPPDAEPSGRRRIRGYIDCLYQDESDGWHIVDYKTNRTTAANVPEIAEQYAMQTGVYALAIEQALGTPPASLALYFLRPETAYEIDWNEEARRRTIDAVNDAIAQQLK